MTASALLGLVCGLLGLVVALPAARAAEPVRQISIYVQPYYEAAKTPGVSPRVAVGKSFDALLASSAREDILAARARIEADPARVTPMTMMVLAIRLYDIGLRDDAAFWFYVAKDRFILLSQVVDVRASGLGGVEDAVRSFATLAGPAINGYAFCDIARQGELRRKALAFVEAHPYAVMFMSQLTARPGGREANLKAALQSARADVEKERAYFDDAKNVNDFREARRKNAMEERFCWH